jgi:GNAT superfamily N-acetyltransferase
MRQFIRLPFSLYRDDPNWVPPLAMDLKRKMNPRKNPFFRNADVAYFLAERDGRITGRICAIRNGLHNDYHNDRVGFFGFFESENDPDTTEALVEGASQWLRDHGLDTMRGPASYSENEEYGLLVDGFDRPPMAIMPYNPPHYINLLEGAGFEKAKDLYAWYLDRDIMKIPKKLHRIVDRIRRRKGVVFRDVNLKDVKGELARIKTIYNDAWSDNWGFLPWTDDLLEYMAPDFKMILIPELVLLAEVDGEPAGFSLVIPDVNQPIKHIGGRLFPFGWLHLLRNIKKTKGIRYVVMGVCKKFRNRGLETVFYIETLTRGQARGHEFCEMSWVIEDNDLMNKAIESFGAQRYKTYRIYDKALAPKEAP